MLVDAENLDTAENRQFVVRHEGKTTEKVGIITNLVLEAITKPRDGDVCHLESCKSGRLLRTKGGETDLEMR